MTTYITDGIELVELELDCSSEQIFEFLNYLEAFKYLRENSLFYIATEDTLDEWQKNFPDIYKRIMEE